MNIDANLCNSEFKKLRPSVDRILFDLYGKFKLKNQNAVAKSAKTISYVYRHSFMQTLQQNLGQSALITLQ